jgi:hypothetical protein
MLPRTSVSQAWRSTLFSLSVLINATVVSLEIDFRKWPHPEENIRVNDVRIWSQRGNTTYGDGEALISSRNSPKIALHSAKVSNKRFELSPLGRAIYFN